MNGWIVFGLVALPVVAVAVWLLLDESIVRIPPGELGLLLVRGKASERSIGPGVHFVPAFRRRTVVAYPSLELAFRSGAEPVEDDDHDLERSSPPIPVVLGDRATATLSYTVRCTIDPTALHHVHDRFGRAGIWSAIRDLSAATIRAVVGDPSTTVDDLVGPRRSGLEGRIAERMGADLAEAGFRLSACSITHVDLGRAGDAIQAAVRARLELEREEAEREMRRVRAESDAAVAQLLGEVAADPALRYRESDAWRDLVAELARRPSAMPITPRAHGPSRPESAPAGSRDDAAPEDADA